MGDDVPELRRRILATQRGKRERAILLAGVSGGLEAVT
jgi:hypothetical protein